MGKCILCNGETSWSGTCKKWGLENNLSKRKKDFYLFVFKGNKKIELPVEKDKDIQEFCKNQEKVRELIREQEMAGVGYFKGQMCPFTQVKVGGSQNVGSAVLFGAPVYDEFTWTHSECMKEYCAIWDEKTKQCSIKKIAQKIK